MELPTTVTEREALHDVIVCGGGPAGIAAATAAARAGARTALIELHGCLGGVWTAGNLTWVIDHENKSGLIREVMQRLAEAGGRGRRSNGELNSGFHPETMKLVLDELCMGAGVHVRLHTRVAGALRDPADGRLTRILTESKSGREAWAGKVFVDCTGDGDLAAQAGCGFDMGRPDNGATQPLSLLALITGPSAEALEPFLSDNGLPWGVPHGRLREELQRAGIAPSYSYPTLFRLTPGLYMLMANHEYGIRCDDADGLSSATRSARAEVHKVISGLRSLGGAWSALDLVATAPQIGVREGRRIHGVHTVTRQEVAAGARHEDAVCRATFCVDIHSTDPKADKGLGGDGVRSKPYDIPLRALIARDVPNLLMAGRCISGDFWAHGSYRVTGNACALGEAAGRAAALAACLGVAAREVPHRDVTKLHLSAIDSVSV